MKQPRPRDTRHADWARRMGGGALAGRSRSVAPIAPRTRTQRTVGINSEGCPDPWVWYRSDDVVTSDGTFVESWPDRIAGHDLFLSDDSGPTPILESSVIDGHDAVTYGTTGSDRKFLRTAFFDPVHFPDGVTMFQIAKSEVRNVIYVDSFVGFTFNVDESYGEWIVVNMAGKGSTSAAFTRSEWLALSGTMGPDFIGFQRDGAEVTDVDYEVAPTQSEWDTTQTEFIDVDPIDVGRYVAEVFMFDSPLSANCYNHWWSYLSNRYPSIGI